MSTLASILIATAAGSLLSLLLAAVLALSARPNWVPVLVSYAIGALLGASLLEVLPEAVQMKDGNIETVAKALLGGILLFFLLEKLVLWRHCHDDICEAHGSHGHNHDHGRSGLMITVGDTFHNFVDGIIIAGAFLVDFGRDGMVVSSRHARVSDRSTCCRVCATVSPARASKLMPCSTSSAAPG